MTNTKARVPAGIGQIVNHPINNTAGTVAHALNNGLGTTVMQPTSVKQQVAQGIGYHNYGKPLPWVKNGGMRK
jgi:hypothetical protein